MCENTTAQSQMLVDDLLTFFSLTNKHNVLLKKKLS